MAGSLTDLSARSDVTVVCDSRAEFRAARPIVPSCWLISSVADNETEGPGAAAGRQAVGCRIREPDRRGRTPELGLPVRIANLFEQASECIVQGDRLKNLDGI